MQRSAYIVYKGYNMINTNENQILSYFTEDQNLFSYREIEVLNLHNNYAYIDNMFPLFNIPENMNSILQSTDWILTIDCPHFFSPVGIYESSLLGRILIYINKDYQLSFAGNSLQDLPYVAFIYHNNIFNKNEIPSYEEAIKKYETWCAENSILTDTYNLFHDKNRELLMDDGDKFFDYIDSIYELIFPTIEEQELTAK